MYLHLGQDFILHTRDIIGIFDMETATLSRHTRDFLRRAETEGAVVSLSDDLPKSFVLADWPDEAVFVSPISSATLKKRCGVLPSGDGDE